MSERKRNVVKLPMMNCSRGAPMGRREYGLPQNCQDKTVRVYRVRLDNGGYDEGGAYWGLGQPLYRAIDVRNDEYCGYIRANSRKQACEALGILPETLMRGVPL